EIDDAQLVVAIRAIDSVGESFPVRRQTAAVGNNRQRFELSEVRWRNRRLTLAAEDDGGAKRQEQRADGLWHPRIISNARPSPLVPFLLVECEIPAPRADAQVLPCDLHLHLPPRAVSLLV